MDRIAQVVGLSPVEIRRRNFLKPGQTTTTEQTIREDIDLGKLLDRALELSDYTTKKTRFARKKRRRGQLREEWGSPPSRMAQDSPVQANVICLLHCGRRLRRRQRARTGFKHRVRPGDKHCALPNRGRSAEFAL